MKHKLLIMLLLLFTASVFARAPYKSDPGSSNSAAIDLGSYIAANRILMFVTNRGSFGYDQGGLLGKNDGLYYPYTTFQDLVDGKNRTSVVFASGIWIGAKDSATGEVRISVSEYSDDFYPGAMINGAFDPTGETNPNYRVFKLYADSMADNPNQDYIDWPVGDGAPVDSAGNPEISGDVMFWTVYNDDNPAGHINDASTNDGLGWEIRQSTFAFSREGALASIVFVKMQIYNMSTITWDSAYVSLWSDPDLGDAGDDFVGSDIGLSLGYCYNDGADADYGSNPPAVGYDFFQGPLEASLGDTAIMWGERIPGFRNLPMSSFNKYINGEDPQNPTHTYNFMKGFTRDGDPLTYDDGQTVDTTKFYGWGDPGAGTGFLDVNSSDRRFMLTTGPFTFRPGDSTEIVAAIIVGRGTDQFASIAELKLLDAFAQKVYDSLFVLPAPPAKPDVTVKTFSDEILLTWGTASEDDPGAYPFEGYAVLQGTSASGPWDDTLGWFDIKNGIGGIIDFRFSAIAQAEISYVAKPGPDDGLQHFVFIDRDFVESGDLVNYKEYFYRVEAYCYDPTAPNGEKTLTSASVVTVSPESPVVGTEYNTIFGDTSIVVTHSAGTAPGDARIVVVDPSAVTGDNYMIVFETDPDLGNVWHVINVTTGDTVVNSWINQSDVSGETDYPIFDGLMAIVSGPPASIKIFQVVANGAGPIDPPVAGALDFAGFPTGVDAGGTPLRPGDDQQDGDGHWAIHTGDNGGSCNGGDRGSFDSFLSRSMRGDNIVNMGGYDYEMRFTGDTTAGVYDSSLGGGSIGIEAFEDAGEQNPIWVPFELWRIGVGTPDDPSDDIRMVPWVLDWGGDDTYNLEHWGCDGSGTSGGSGEHSASGLDNDPYTDWVYWYLDDDETPGDAGYQDAVTQILAWTSGNTVYDFEGTEIFARTVLINWNGDTTDAGDFNQNLPEPGTVFRIVTAKPNGPADQYTFSSAGFAPTVDTAGSSVDLDKIKVVPNPYYLFSDYDISNNSRALKFTNLPEICTIRIYTLMGDLIMTIEKDDMTSEATWDVENRFGIPIASGIYIYHINAPGFGEKIGKMAIFTEVELLDQY